MEKVKFKDLINQVSATVGMSQKDTKVVIDAFLDELVGTFESNKGVSIPKLGTFNLAEQKAKPEREGIVNPKTGEKGMLPATEAYTKVKFKVASGLKESLKEKL